jgi:hypothetical protein
MNRSIARGDRARCAVRLCGILVAAAILSIATGMVHMSESFAQSFAADTPLQQTVRPGAQVPLGASAVDLNASTITFSVVSGSAQIVDQQSTSFDSGTVTGTATVLLPIAGLVTGRVLGAPMIPIATTSIWHSGWRRNSRRDAPRSSLMKPCLAEARSPIMP